jgi:MFS family permease
MTDSALPEPAPYAPRQSTGTEDAGRLVTASTARLIAVLTLLVLLTEVVPLQIQMISLILPKMGASFPSAGANITWTITILTITGSATMALVGKAGDVAGKKRVLLLISLLAVVGTLVCALTSSWALFLVGRGITGVSLGIVVLNLSLIRDLFPRRWIPVAVGFVGTGFAVSAILGPLVTGVLNDHFSWRSAFWFLFIYTLVIIPLLALVVPESPVRSRQRFDVPGAVLLGAGVGGVLVYLSEGATWGWTNSAGLGYLIGGLVALVACLAWELRAAAPMLDFPLLRQPRVLLVMIAQLLLTAVQTVVPLMIAYLFETPPQKQLQQQVLAGFAAKAKVPASVVAPFVHFQGTVSGAGYSAFQVAWHVSVPMAVFTVIGAPVGGLIARRVGARLPLIAGIILMAAGTGLWIGWHSTWQEQVAIGVLYGVGSGFDFAAWPNLIMDVVPADKQGLSGGMVQVFGGIGASAATALITLVLAAHPFKFLITPPGGKPISATIPQVYLNSGFSQGYLLLGVIPAVAALVIALVLRSGRAPARGGAPVDAPEAVIAEAAQA